MKINHKSADEFLRELKLKNYSFGHQPKAIDGDELEMFVERIIDAYEAAEQELYLQAARLNKLLKAIK